MDNKKTRKKRVEYKSRVPYKRLPEEKVIKIIGEIQAGNTGKREVCRKYGLNRQTLQKWIRRLSVRNLAELSTGNLFTSMTDNQQNLALAKKIQELTQALDAANLKIAGLETMIEIAEEELKIQIKKKAGTKQLKK